MTEAAREAERAAVRNNLAALWHSQTSQTSGEQASLHDLGVSAESVRGGEGKELNASHSEQRLPRPETQEPRCSITCFTSTKVQNLTPEQHQAVTLADGRPHTLGRSDEAAGASNVAL